MSGSAGQSAAETIPAAADERVLAPSPLDGGSPWRDHTRPAAERVADLLGRMTLAEKIAQLYSVWVGVRADGDAVVPHQHELAPSSYEWPDVIRDGLGQFTRPFGTAPTDPLEGARALERLQADVTTNSRHGIPAVVHEECLNGFMTWGATVYPTPLAWGASFDPDLVEEMAYRVGAHMWRLGIHQGLAPVLDVTRDARWGRTEETIGEDPYLVGTVGTAYVRGLERSGVIATLKHFAGYSGSRGARNFGPVSAGPRELADVYLPPFEMALREGGARSVMHSYAEIDGVPAAASVELLTTLLRDTWGFEGTVVADYFGVSFLEMLHHIADNRGSAAGLALAAGVDVELPSIRCFGEPLVEAIQRGEVPESLIDRAVTRVLLQKVELGLLDPDWAPIPVLAGEADPVVDLDPPADRALARRIAEESVVLLANDGALPLRAGARVALVGPQSDTADAMLGCYTFPRHVASQFPEYPDGVPVPTLLTALREADLTVTHEAGCGVDTDDRSGFAAAVAAARDADVIVAALGDRSALFGMGTSGEGCDAANLALPGVQGELLEELLATGKPVVLVLLTGRPYALGAYADRLAATVQAFFPGEEGGPAVARVLTGDVSPSGRLPVSVPRTPDSTATYLAPELGHLSDVSSVDPTPVYPFGHGLAYTSFEWSAEESERLDWPTDGSVSVSVTVRNTGERAGADVVQLYLHDAVAQVTRPVIRLIGYAKVALEAGQARQVTFTVPADLCSFVGLNGRRVVEPGDVELRLGASSVDIRHTVKARLTGALRTVDHRRALRPGVTVSP
ncbi:glycoside hydrolase family 3 N-terminal domain-containing protein [Luedemannella helvata]|uniref:Glycoside hydrolase family 3 N-terminal domain-containing protein n=1 Tax=Luedemannella helvata TaxID=349315 RepID=A0ABP4WZ53_9ACTN